MRDSNRQRVMRTGDGTVVMERGGKLVHQHSVYGASLRMRTSLPIAYITFERKSMDLMLKGKVAIVGGASKGLGRACAEALAGEGANIVMCSRSSPDLEKAAEEIRNATGVQVLPFAGDLDRHETIRESHRCGGRQIRAPRRARQQFRRPSPRLRAEQRRRSSGPPPCSARCSFSRACRGKRCRI